MSIDDLDASDRASIPSWLVTEPFEETHLGVLRSGKEAQIDLVERTAPDGRSCVLACKRYLPREVKSKGTLEALGVSRASTFRNDVQYREGRQFRKSRDRRAVERMSTYGKRLLQDRWLNHEHDVMRALWDAGVQVPYPVGFVPIADAGMFFLEFVGDLDRAAPQLGRARLDRDELVDAFDQFVAGLHAITAAGWAHGDLSPYNLLWWPDEEGRDRLWFIDFPQAVDIAANPAGLDFLHRDVVNVCTWFARKGVDVDAEEVFADVLHSAFH